MCLSGQHKTSLFPVHLSMWSWWLSIGILHVRWVLLRKTVQLWPPLPILYCLCTEMLRSTWEKSHTTVLTGLASDLWPHISNVLPIIQAILIQMPIKFDFTFSEIIISYSLSFCQIHKIPPPYPHLKAADFILHWENQDQMLPTASSSH